MIPNTPAADAMYAQVVATLRNLNAAHICTIVHAQLTRIDDRRTFEMAAKDASRDDLLPLAARSIVRARLSTLPPPNYPGTPR